MSQLREAYKALKEFPKYKETMWERENTLETPASRIKRLRMEKQEAVAKFDAEILRIKLEAQDTGKPASLTETRTAFEKRMKEVREGRKAAFRGAVRQALAEGQTIPNIMEESGCTNVNLMYSIKNSEEIPANATGNLAPDVRWEYHDHVGVHRYALSVDRNWVKVHAKEDDGAPMYLTYPGMEYWAGGVVKYQESRIQALAELLDGSYAGSTKETPNPYRREK